MKNILLWSLGILLVAALFVFGIIIGAEMKPITDFARETIALLTNSRLPESSSRLEFSLTTPTDLAVTFDPETQGAVLRWSGSTWRPSRPPDSNFKYEVTVFAPNNTRISSFSSNARELSINSFAEYLGQSLKFTVQAVGTILIGEYEYNFKSDLGEFRWIVPTATPTNTPTSTPTNTPTNTATYTLTPTPTNTPTSTSTETPTRLPADSPQLSYVISQPSDVSLNYNARTDSSTLSWSKSNWVPTKPSGSSKISYEVTVIYPKRTFGPYNVTGNRREFTNLDVQENQRLRFEVTAIGTVKIGQYSYEFKSKVTELGWTRPTSTPTNTPTNTPTHTPTDTPTNTPTATSTSTPTNTPTNTPTRLPENSPLLSNLISTPDSLSFTYIARTSSGTIRWSKSSWMPSKPDGAGEITYEVRWIHGGHAYGPFSALQNIHRFTSMHLQESQRITITVTAVGSIRIGPHTYEVKSKVAELGWARPTSTPTFTPTNTSTPTNTATPTSTPTPTPTRLPASHPRLAYTLAAPSNLRSAFTEFESIKVDWTDARWRPKMPANAGAISYIVSLMRNNSSTGGTRTVKGTSVSYSNVKSYAGSRVRFMVEAIGTIRIDGHEYKFRSKPAEGGSLYVPRYDYMLEQDETDSRLPGYCSIGLFLNRGSGYDFNVAYFGNTYKWYRVDVFGPDGRELGISSTRSTVLGDKANVQRYANTTFKPGVYTARATELDPRKVKTFAFVIKEQGDYSLQIGGWGC